MPDSYKLIIDTLRLILFLECNLKCTYCCNRQEQFNSLFREKKISEINFNFYKNICITGGEPFLYKNIFYKILNLLPEDKDIYKRSAYKQLRFTAASLTYQY
jgi:molybdenum cofactor biosynthesis enzyme MoaA